MWRNLRKNKMSAAPAKRPKVPEGKTRNLITRQMKATKTGFVGYETIYDEFQTEIKYETPKRP